MSKGLLPSREAVLFTLVATVCLLLIGIPTLTAPGWARQQPSASRF